MDFKKLAIDITVFLTPFFPYLVLAREEAIKEVGKKFGEAIWNKAKSLWGRLRSPSLEGVAVILAEAPNDKSSQATFAKLLSRQLQSFPEEIVRELIKMMKEDSAVQTILIREGSTARDLLQRLSRNGVQEIEVSASQVGNITQEQ